jgi:hypothetical protein
LCQYGDETGADSAQGDFYKALERMAAAFADLKIGVLSPLEKSFAKSRPIGNREKSPCRRLLADQIEEYRWVFPHL